MLPVTLLTEELGRWLVVVLVLVADLANDADTITGGGHQHHHWQKQEQADSHQVVQQQMD